MQIMRVSQPLRPPSTSTASLQAWPNCARSYPVFGARPLTGRVSSAPSAGEDPPAAEVAPDPSAGGAGAVSVTVTGDGVSVVGAAVAVVVALVVSVTVVVAAVGSPGAVHAAPRVLTTRSAIVARHRVVVAKP